jgi:hypothetical protein
MQVEIGRYKEVNKGALKAFFELFVPVIRIEGMKVIDCQHFVGSGGKNWFNWPSKEFKKNDGSKSYFPFISFTPTTFRTTLETAVNTALQNIKPEQKYASKTHTTEPEDIVQGDAPALWF